MSIELLSLILFASILALLATGLPIAFAIGGVSVVFAIALWGFDHIYILAGAAYSNLQDLNLVAIPLFVLMGWIFQKSGIADDLFEAMHAWLGNVSGGLAIGVIIVSALFAAICGELVAAIFTITSVALAPMLKRGYNKILAVGCILAGGLLGLIIPPSVEIIIYASMTGESIGRMYMGAFLPGFLLASMHIVYVGVRCHLQPELGPSAPPETRAGWGERIAKLKGVVVPFILLLIIIIGIYSGAFTPMEASAVGATGALICAAIYRRLNWKVVTEAVLMTLRISCMIAWLLIAIGCFTAVYSGIGARQMALQIAQTLPGGGWGMIIAMQLALMLIGMFLDDLAVIMIFAPIFASAVRAIGFDSLWYGIVFVINMQLALLTPPYGFALFCMRAAVPEGIDISMADIYRAAFPFAGIVFLCLVLVIIFPPIATFLPHLIIR